ncbi:MAG: CoA transferase [Halobacteria archaeon]
MGLEGIRVLDLSQFFSGPRAGQLLADYGAEVIKIEPPGGEAVRLLSAVLPGAERSLSILNRNKKGLTLNLKHPRGAELFRQLVKSADVLIENFVPGTMERLGHGYETLRELNPRLIYLAVSGFGRTGPRANQPAYDLIAQSAAGLVALQENPDRTPRVLIADFVSGAYGALAVLAALLERERTGKGRLIDLSMQEVMYIHNYRALSARAMGERRQEMVEALALDTLLTDPDRRLPFWNIWHTKDGLLAAVTVTDEEWRRLAEAVGVEELKKPAYSSIAGRIKNRKRGIELLDPWFRGRTTAEAESALRAQGVPCAPVLDLDGVNRDVQLEARGMLAEAPHPRLGAIGVPGSPVGGSVRRAHPDAGEHNAEILGALGVSTEELARLKKERVI